MPRKIYITESQLCRLFMLNESYFYDYVEDYDSYYVFEMYLKNPNGKQQWGPLINPESYAKALQEFTKYGKLMAFPGDEVFKWLGIIMKNTAILTATTSIAGHSTSFPMDEAEWFVEQYFGEDVVYEFGKERCILNLNPELARKILASYDITEATDKSGQNYLDFVDQDYADRADNAKEQMANFEDLSGLFDAMLEFNREFGNSEKYFEIDYENKTARFICDYYGVIELTGIYDWMTLPDGSDAFSDYGLSPLYKILDEYNPDMSAEEVLVLVNRALDVYHQRGDLASMFIQGGSMALSKISR